MNVKQPILTLSLSIVSTAKIRWKNKLGLGAVPTKLIVYRVPDVRRKFMIFFEKSVKTLLALPWFF